MSPGTSLRWTGAIWFLPAVFAVSCLFGIGVTSRNGYPTGDIAEAGVAVCYAGPLLAAFAATRFRGFARFIAPFRADRSGLAVVVAAWWPLLLGGPFMYCLAIVSTARALPADGASWLVLLVDFGTMLTCALLGFASAWALPIVVAVPAVTVGLFLWMTYGPASSNTVLHNLNPSLPGCCISAYQPATISIRAILLMSAVICVGIALPLARRQWARTSRLLVVPVVVGSLLGGFGVGVAVARTSDRPLTFEAVEPRTTPLRCQSDQGVRACVWPENADRATEVAGVVAELNPQLRRLGLQQISRVTEDFHDRDAVYANAQDGVSRDDLRRSLSSGYVDHLAGCIGAIGRAADDLSFLTALLAGVAPDYFDGRFDPDPLPAATSRFAQAQADPAAVGAWFRERLRSVHCQPPPP